MAGHIRCAKCEASRTSSVCPRCGEYKCYISLYYNKKHWRFWHYSGDSKALDHERAQRDLNKIRTEIDAKRFNPSDLTEGKIAERKFNVQADRWLTERENDFKAGEIAYETFRLYRSYSKNHFEPFFKQLDVHEIDDDLMKQFKDEIRGKKLSLKVKRNILAIFHVFLKWLNATKAIKEMPAMPAIEGDDTIPIVVTEYEDQQNILDRIPGPFRSPIEFAMETGLRPGELCALWISDISLPRKEATIQRTYSGKTLKNSTKGKNKKPIPLSDRALQLVLGNLNDRVGDVFLFINPTTDKGFRPRTLQNAWAKYSGLKGQIDLKNATRHSFCTQIVEAGATQLEAMALMRHSDIRSTLKYFKADTKKLRHIVNRRGTVANINTKTNRTSTERS